MTEQERGVIAGSDSIAMNAYARHFDQVGIVPTHYLLLDEDETSLEVLADVPAILAREPFTRTRLWLTQSWFDRFPGDRSRCRLVEHTPFFRVASPPQFRMRFWKPAVRRENLLWVKERLESRSMGVQSPFSMSRLLHYWAKSTDQPLFCFRGTLTAALNLAWLKDYRTVQLVGVDLTDGSHFYGKEAYQAIVERDNQRFQTDTKLRHGTTLWVGDGFAPPVQPVLSRIAELYRRTGRTLYVSNPESLLVREGIIPHRSIVPQDLVATS
ncbi:hypothetical protein AB1L88_21575 [Tautonia sp. JC769]|uniref:hypothetical protein n=1 Tax=Tautonia sp. JC769 TaxID=3232135 RepID=UPI003457D95C